MSDAGRKRAERDLAKLQRKWDREDKIARFKRFLGKKPMQYKRIPVPDWDDRTRLMSDFRQAYGEFLGSNINQENSRLQNHTTQLFWHQLYLQKQRMKRLGVTLVVESERVQRSDAPRESVISQEYFDGRYEVIEANEAIYMKRSFCKDGRELRAFFDYDSVDYSILSAKQQGDKEVVCPNCGNATTRENLIDGCDFCRTKFTIEDLEDRIGGFHIVSEVAVEGLSLKGREASLSFAADSASMVRAYDPNFSLRNFRASVFSKVAAIHFCDTFQEISAFSDIDLSDLKDSYKNIVHIDFRDLVFFNDDILIKAGLKEKNNYYVEDGLQHIKCTVHLGLFELIDGQIVTRMEAVPLELQKSADCLTQNICGPSLLTCEGCHASLSLMDGKTCPYCGRELDMINHDWVITKYESKPTEYGRNWREFD